MVTGCGVAMPYSKLLGSVGSVPKEKPACGTRCAMGGTVKTFVFHTERAFWVTLGSKISLFPGNPGGLSTMMGLRAETPEVWFEPPFCAPSRSTPVGHTHRGRP